MTTLPKFLIGYGPSGHKLHIKQSEEFLSLCKTTSVGVIETGDVNHGQICPRCIKELGYVLCDYKFQGAEIPEIETARDLATVVQCREIY